MQFYPNSPKRPNVLHGQELGPKSPPPYEHSPSSSLLLSETTTTRTETVTTTTTETTTHFFSLPYWKKRTLTGTQSSSVQRNSAEDFPGHISSNSAIHPPFVNKALPPTPPEFLETSPDDLTNELPASTTLPSPNRVSEYTATRKQKQSGGSQSATVLAHAALGIGLPHVGLPRASASFPLPEKNTIPFTSTSSSSPTTPVRRAKSAYRLQTRHFSESVSNDMAGGSVEPRSRGISFNGESLLNIGRSEIKGKGKESSVQVLGPTEPQKMSPKPLVRKSSFWTRRKGAESIKPTPNSEPGNLPDLPSLPLVDHVYPFDISDFSNVPPVTPTNDSPNPKPNGPSQLSRSHSDNTQLSNLSPDMLTISSSVPWPTSYGNDVITETLQSNGNPTSFARPRRQTSTPLLHRLSLGVFLSPEPSPTTNLKNDQPQISIKSPVLPTLRKPESHFPKPLTGEESPEVYLSRLKAAVNKSEVAGILASR